MAKLIKFDTEARAKMLKGVNTLAKRKGITRKEAQRRQAVAIALSAAGKKRKK